MQKTLIKLNKNELVPNEENEKIHTPENLEMIRASIEATGYITPIIVDEDKNILSGHGRYAVLESGEIEVLQIVGLSEAEKKKFRLYDNRTAQTGHFDMDLLSKTVEEILELDEDFSVPTLGMKELTEIFGEELTIVNLGDKEPKEKAEKDAPERKQVYLVYCERDLETYLSDREGLNYEHLGAAE